MLGSQSAWRYPMPAEILARGEIMGDWVRLFWDWNRVANSQHHEDLIAAIRGEVDGKVLSVPAGEKALDWTMPPRWTVRSAVLTDVDGQVLADYKANPLCLWAHSVAFDGMVSRDELLKHVTSDPDRPDVTPWRYHNQFRPQAREWGFSLPHSLVERLGRGPFWVRIDTDLTETGCVQALDVLLPGESPRTFMFAAHTCHPAQVSDGLANVAVLMQLYSLLRARPKRRYSYRFVFGPEYYGAAVWLKSPMEPREMAPEGGLYLDMASAHTTLAIQSGASHPSRLERALRNVLDSHIPEHGDYPYRKLWGNDEQFYEGAGFGIPFCALAREMHREYHSDLDTPDAMSAYGMAETLWILLQTVDVLETDRRVRAKFTGPLCLSARGLCQGRTTDPGAYDMREMVMRKANGQRSMLDLAEDREGDFFKVRDFCQALVAQDAMESLDV
jgi:aminopeptidase-like protein